MSASFQDRLILKDRRFLFASSKNVAAAVNEPIKVSPDTRFIDDGTYATVKLIGRIADCVYTNGSSESYKIKTVMGDFGDSNVTSNPNYKAIGDGDAVRGRMMLECFDAESKDLCQLWNAQSHNLAKYVRFSNVMYLMSFEQNKFDTFITELDSGSGGGKVAIKVLWEKFAKPTKEDNVIEWRDGSKVVEGAVYHPRVLDHYHSPAMNIVDDVVVQPAIYDEWGYLIPPWHILTELRPGSVVTIDAMLVPYDLSNSIDDELIGQERIFKAYGRSAQVLHQSGLPCQLNEGPAVRPPPVTVPLRRKKTARMSTGGRPAKRVKVRQDTED